MLLVKNVFRKLRRMITNIIILPQGAQKSARYLMSLRESEHIKLYGVVSVKFIEVFECL